MSAAVLLIEDDADTARLLAARLEAPPERFFVATAGRVSEGLLRLAESNFDCVLLDYRLPDGDGIECLRSIRRSHPNLPVLFVTGAGSEQVAVEAMKLGATDYMVKQGQYYESLPIAVREAIGARYLSRVEEVPQFSAVPPSSDALKYAARERIVGESVAFMCALGQVSQAARSFAPVLLQGETGTGKELFARAVHALSSRGAGPFVAVNCAGIPPNLVESELFGYVRGAFTGAYQDHGGLFESASRGTLFLDEVSEMSPELQAKLLRVLQDGEVRPIGSARARRLDVRLVAASNRDLRVAVRDGSLRLDLYHRLCVFLIAIPPLRDRAGDVELLARHFLVEYAARDGKVGISLHASALCELIRHAWPGNVRELQNEMQRLIVACRNGDTIRAENLSPWLRGNASDPKRARPLHEILKNVELATVRARLREHAYRRAATARSLGITREALWQKLRQLGISLPRSGRGAD